MHVSILGCVRENEGESKCFSFDSGLRKCCVMTPLALQCLYGYRIGRTKNEGGEDGTAVCGRRKKWRLPGLLNTAVNRKRTWR